MTKVLMVDSDKCTSCRLCELVCSERSVGAFQPSRSHIQVTIEAEKAFYFPKVCVQCEEAACLEACPTEALERDPTTNAVVLLEARCDACGACEPACPYGVIRCFDGMPQKCTLCGGDPECVRFCAPGALKYEAAEKWPDAARQAYTDRLESIKEMGL